MRSALMLPAFVAAVSLFAQAPSPAAAPLDPPHREWTASWITHPTAPLRDPLVLHFRRSLTLPAVPAGYVVRVSADNRFILYVNGKRAGDGPARGDLNHWRYQRFDLAPLLKPGDNLVTATVWNWGNFAPVAQMSDRTAFLLESEAAGDTSISTPGGWMVEEEPGHQPLDRTSVSLQEYFASGPGEEIDASKYDWNWDASSPSGGHWVKPADPMRDSIFPGTGKAHSADTTGDNPWYLVPDGLPHMEYTETSPGESVRADSSGLRGFPSSQVSVPAGKHVHILLDRKTLTTAYPRLAVSGGQGAKIRITYSEALYDNDKHKADRNAVDDRQAYGLNDSFLPDGGDHRVFEPLWWRTWRYLDLDIQTAGQPLALESLTASFTAYPFEERAKLQSGDPDLDKIWDISWRTARLDAHETYMDTPYYEQLQYVGDTRIQALISYTVGGDDRLARQALEAFNNSRIPEGITRSRYPGALPQNIPTFSLLWIGMLHDWWMYRPDLAPIRDSLQGVRSVLNWYAQYQQPDGLLRKTPWWSFVDWVQDKQEIPTYDANGESCVTSLHYLGALEQAADLEKALGYETFWADDQSRAVDVRSGLLAKCWSNSRQLLADTPDLKSFSQQANILAVLYDVIPGPQQQDVLRSMLVIEPGTTPDGVLSASYYFRFYLARALEHVPEYHPKPVDVNTQAYVPQAHPSQDSARLDMADHYLDSLDPWRKLLPLHFSTWPEIPGDTRSDSHAWTAHPIYDLLTLVAGIEPASPGFATVRIAPHLGKLPSLSASFPHPDGIIDVKYQRHGSGIDAAITLPGKLAGQFVFHGQTHPLKPGVNLIAIQ